MKFIITEDRIEKLKKHIQNFINISLYRIREDSEDWGLGEMDELYEIDSIDKIVIDRIVPHTRLAVYVNIYQNKKREDYDNTLGEIQYDLKDAFPSIVLLKNEIILE